MGLTKKRKKSRRLTVTQVGERLRLMILNGELAPGTRLRQQHLARRFNVSINAVREALMELKGGGWVESAHYRGVFVAHFDPHKQLEALEVREMLEGFAARLCCQRINREELTELRQLIEKCREECRLAGPEHERACLRLDRRFHARLAQIAGNRTLQALSDANRVMLTFDLVPMPEGPDPTWDEHLAILDAIEGNRPDDAERLARSSVRALRLRFAERLAAESLGGPTEPNTPGAG
jgi:DNA-binding GntR family transcriptional regulator